MKRKITGLETYKPETLEWANPILVSYPKSAGSALIGIYEMLLV